jgi:hypothetical protein
MRIQGGRAEREPPNGLANPRRSPRIPTVRAMPHPLTDLPVRTATRPQGSAAHGIAGVSAAVESGGRAALPAARAGDLRQPAARRRAPRREPPPRAWGACRADRREGRGVRPAPPRWARVLLPRPWNRGAQHDPHRGPARPDRGRRRADPGKAAFLAEAEKSGFRPRVDQIEVARIEAPEAVRERLQLDDGPVLRRSRRYLADDRPVELAVSYLPLSIAEGRQPLIPISSGRRSPTHPSPFS